MLATSGEIGIGVETGATRGEEDDIAGLGELGGGTDSGFEVGGDGVGGGAEALGQHGTQSAEKNGVFDPLRDLLTPVIPNHRFIAAASEQDNRFIEGGEGG